jgi:hypothetical protein
MSALRRNQELSRHEPIPAGAPAMVMRQESRAESPRAPEMRRLIDVRPAGFFDGGGPRTSAFVRIQRFMLLMSWADQGLDPRAERRHPPSVPSVRRSGHKAPKSTARFVVAFNVDPPQSKAVSGKSTNPIRVPTSRRCALVLSDRRCRHAPNTQDRSPANPAVRRGVAKSVPFACPTLDIGLGWLFPRCNGSTVRGHALAFSEQRSPTAVAIRRLMRAIETRWAERKTTERFASVLLKAVFASRAATARARRGIRHRRPCMRGMYMHKEKFLSAADRRLRLLQCDPSAGTRGHVLLRTTTTYTGWQIYRISRCTRAHRSRHCTGAIPSGRTTSAFFLGDFVDDQGAVLLGVCPRQVADARNRGSGLEQGRLTGRSSGSSTKVVQFSRKRRRKTARGKALHESPADYRPACSATRMIRAATAQPLFQGAELEGARRISAFPLVRPFCTPITGPASSRRDRSIPLPWDSCRSRPFLFKLAVMEDPRSSFGIHAELHGDVEQCRYPGLQRPIAPERDRRRRSRRLLRRARPVAR